MHKHAYAAALAVAVVTLSGCASLSDDPWFQDTLVKPEKVEITDLDTGWRLSYLSRLLMDRDDRKKLVATLHDNAYYRSWGAVEYGGIAGLATDASVGQLGSSAGMNASATVGAAVMAVGWLANMAPDQMSQGFVPATFNGQPLATTGAEADRWLANQMAEQIKSGAPKVGFNAECLYGCDGNSNQVWWLKRQATAKADGHLFWPEDLALVFNFEPVEKADEDPVRDAALGFPVAWQTKFGHNARLVIVTDLKRGEDGKPKVIVGSDDKTRIPDSGRGTAQTRIGRELLRAIYASPFFLYGDDDLYPGMVVFNGVAYGWKSLSEQPPLRYRLEEPSTTTSP